MIADLVNKAREIQGGEDGWVSLRDYNTDKSRKAYFVDGLMAEHKRGPISWAVSRSKDLAYCLLGDFVVVVTRHSSQYGSRKIGGTVDTYDLSVFHGRNEVFATCDRCDNAVYDSCSPRLPVMDIYDVAVAGAFRRPRTAHVCGAYGFGRSLDDRCPACEEERAQRARVSA